jgi:uncharacterized protein YqiB (DUF1249 family)
MLRLIIETRKKITRNCCIDFMELNILCSINYRKKLNLLLPSGALYRARKRLETYNLFSFAFDVVQNMKTV